MAVATGLPFKSLASWKSWWSGKTIASDIAKSLCHHMDPTNIAGNGRMIHLTTPGKPCAQDALTHAKICEALLHAYPAEHDPSGYLLGDAVLHLDEMLGHTILGKPSANPMKESTRRDNALKDGTNLKLLLSYIRNSSGRHDKGRHAEITYLKELASSKHKPKRRSSGSQGSTPVASPMSPTYSTATTIGLDGQSLYTDKTGSENSPAENVEPLLD